MSQPQTKRSKLDKRIARYLAAKDNVITRAAVVRLGGTDDYIKSKIRCRVWQRLQKGVYLHGAAPPTWRQQVRAAVLAAGDGAMPTHATYMALRGVDSAPTDPIQITVDHGHKLELRGNVTVYRSRRALVRASHVDGLPVPPVERCLIDYAAVVTEELVEVAVEHVLRMRWTTEERIWRAIVKDGGRGVKGTAALRRVMESRPAGRPARSVLETMVSRLLRRAGLVGIRNFPVVVGDKKYEIDVAFADDGVALEADSRWHVTKTQQAKDAVRQREIESLGFVFVRTNWTEVVCHPDELIARLRSALARRAA